MHKFIKLVTFAAVVAAATAAGAGDAPPSSWAWLGFVREGGADEQPVRVGFGGDHGNFAPQRPGFQGDVHIKDLLR